LSENKEITKLRLVDPHPDFPLLSVARLKEGRNLRRLGNQGSLLRD